MKTLRFEIELQQCSEWCWAAVTAAVCKCYDDPSSTGQREVASLVLRLPTDSSEECNCREDPFANCNEPRNLALVLGIVRHDRGNPVDGITTLSFDDVKSNIDNGRPIVVQVTLDDPAASGHAVAIYGYTDDGLVSIADPMHPDDFITINFADFVAARETVHGTWKAAYLTKRANE